MVRGDKLAEAGSVSGLGEVPRWLNGLDVSGGGASCFNHKYKFYSRSLSPFIFLVVGVFEGRFGQ